MSSGCNVTYESHALSGSTYLAEAVVLITTNICFIICLYKCRLHINWKMTVFVLNLSVSDTFSGCALLAMSISMFFYFCTVPSWIERIIQLACSFSILASSFNYTSLFFVQYLAVKHPLFYQTRCTKSFFVKIFLLQYAVICAFEVWKWFTLGTDDEYWFSVLEIVVMGFTLVFNIVVYSYVLHVVDKRQRFNAHRSGNEHLLQSISIPKEYQTFLTKVYWKNLLTTLTNDYWGITTAGLQLVIYIVTFVPLWGIDIHVTAFGSSDGVYDIYTCQATMCHFGIFIWFLRGIINPLMHIIRDPKLHVCNRQHRNSESKRTMTTGFEDSGKKKTSMPTVSEIVQT